MKVVILCGGLGTRISEETNKIPKPMVKIGQLPILVHIMRIYKKFGFNQFILATGYKSKIIKKYFSKDKFVNCVYTGKNTPTGGRLLKLKKLLKLDENFMLTYGDGLSNVNLKKLDNFHSKNKNLATITGVRPLSRYGILKIKGRMVTSFREKQPINNSWVNGGFFIFNKDIFKYIKNDQTILEKEPLETLAKKKKLSVLKHNGFWHSIDTKRDKEQIEYIVKKSKILPWMKNIK